ncbi:catalase-like [Uloborus diversus]|uniref:catalase-like n=1 Tax=Uloborus diversus TaxID=327109 RepID=UPI002409A271|nr:catalase-like [Uloborus diversus]
MLFVILLFSKAVAGDVCSNGSLKDFTAEFAVLKSESGIPIRDKVNSMTIGPRGPMLLQDFVYIEEIAHFNRERIPDRVVHGKGNGAFGYFEVTDDITRYTRAKLFNRLGKRTSIAVRFSIANAEVGSPDAVRDIRGMSVKFYTEEGNWDLLGLSVPIFPVRDPLLFPSVSRVLGADPVSHLRQISEAFWDFLTLRPEVTGAAVLLLSDRGIPQSYRNMDAFAVNTFKMVNATGNAVFCKFSWLTDQGTRYLIPSRARQVSGTDLDSHGRDLFQAIEEENYPSWTLYIQVMTMEQAKQVDFNPFDATKEWSRDAFPFIRAGKIVLNRNPKNHFAEVEQLAMSPANLIPGIEPSPDKVLQGRLFSYPDTQRYRLGANYNQIPVNCPIKSIPNNYERNGFMTLTRKKGTPNYYPNSFKGPVQDPTALESAFDVCGIVARHDSSEEDNFSQARIYYNQMEEDEKERLVQNMVSPLQRVSKCLQDRAVDALLNVDPDLGQRIIEGLNKTET